ncbi:VanZ family protein [Pradoshia sp.]
MIKSGKNQNRLTFSLLVIYLIVMTWIIVFKMSFSFHELPNFRSINLIPFGGSTITNNQVDISEIINNVIIFVPFGIYLSMLKPDMKFIKKVILIAAVSFSYEIIQFIFAIGGTDITDLLGNTLGGIIGISLYSALFKFITKKYTNRVLNAIALIGTVVFFVLFGILFFANH